MHQMELQKIVDFLLQLYFSLKNFSQLPYKRQNRSQIGQNLWAAFKSHSELDLYIGVK